MELIFYFILGAASIIGGWFIIERGWELRWRKVLPPRVEEAAEQCRTHEDLPRLRGICDTHPSPLSRLLLSAIDHLDWPKAENATALETRARHEVARLERGLVVLEIVVGTAPLLGLVGTIFGLITLFGDMGKFGTEEQQHFANGIAVALNSTLLGLMTAIPALIAWSYYTKKVETFAIELETICDGFLRAHYHEKHAEPADAPRPPRTRRKVEA